MGQKTVYGRVNLPSNESILNTLTPNKQRAYMELREAAATVAKERPDINTSVYTEYMHDFLETARKDQEIMLKKETAAKAQDIVPDARTMHNESRARLNEFKSNFLHEKLPKYGADGQQAMNALNKELQGPSIIAAFGNQIYNPRKGGWQWGGIVGLLIGGLIARQITGGLNAGNLFGIVTGIIGAFTGAWLGNQTVGLISGFTKSKTPGAATGASPAPGQGQGPTQEQESPAAAASQTRAEPAPLTPEATRAADEERNAALGIEGGEQAEHPQAPPTGGGGRTPAGGKSQDGRN